MFFFSVTFLKQNINLPCSLISEQRINVFLSVTFSKHILLREASLATCQAILYVAHGSCVGLENLEVLLNSYIAVFIVQYMLYPIATCYQH